MFITSLNFDLGKYLPSLDQSVDFIQKTIGKISRTLLQRPTPNEPAGTISETSESVASKPKELKIPIAIDDLPRLVESEELPKHEAIIIAFIGTLLEIPRDQKFCAKDLAAICKHANLTSDASYEEAEARSIFLLMAECLQIEFQNYNKLSDSLLGNGENNVPIWALPTEQALALASTHGTRFKEANHPIGTIFALGFAAGAATGVTAGSAAAKGTCLNKDYTAGFRAGATASLIGITTIGLLGYTINRLCR
ncbi:MAG: hypothetical protein ACOYK9_05010 [Chlamydiia bacterium]